jgi:hypothetical protein
VVLRDLQWLQHLKGGGQGIPPDVLQPLGGGAETLFGDLVFSADSRFFVFELKSSSGRISSEWKTDSGEPKALYTHIQKTVRRISEAYSEVGKPEDDDAKFLRLSLRGHFFLYPKMATTGVRRTEIWAEPYIMAAMKRVKEPSWKMTELPFDFGLLPTRPGQHHGEMRISLSSVMARDRLLAFRSPTPANKNHATAEGTVGLTPDELDVYLAHLSQAGGNSEVRSVVVDNNGHLFAVVHDIEGVARLLTRLQQKKPVNLSSLDSKPPASSGPLFELS